jgi:hypothetical protein
MRELKSKLNEMDYDIEAIIDPNSLKKVSGGGNSNQTSEAEDPCKARAITGN